MEHVPVSCLNPGGQFAGWLAAMRVPARRERPHPAPRSPCSRQRMGGGIPLWVTNPAGTKGWLGQAA